MKIDVKDGQRPALNIGAHFDTYELGCFVRRIAGPCQKDGPVGQRDCRLFSDELLALMAASLR